ncbi:uncharacterized protein LOC135211946 [Macrobrachium nipponense]|uniref:uncharacterized protein LOC135211946 n=1 Tax=Macrobrachium nipponense TaxID=159736 RepID=UPI0030C837EF
MVLRARKTPFPLQTTLEILDNEESMPCPSHTCGDQFSSDQPSNQSQQQQLTCQEYGYTQEAPSDLERKDHRPEQRQASLSQPCQLEEPLRHESEDLQQEDVVSEPMPQKESENEDSQRTNHDESDRDPLQPNGEISGSQETDRIQPRNVGSSEEYEKEHISTPQQTPQEHEMEKHQSLSPPKICQQEEETDPSEQSQSPSVENKCKNSALHSSDHTTEEQDRLSLPPEESPQQEVKGHNQPQLQNGDVLKDSTKDDDPSLFNEIDQRTLRLRKMNDTVSCKIMHTILTWGTKDKQSNVGFYEYLLQEKKVPNNILKMKFTKDQKEKMYQDPSGSIFDITLLFLCIKYACEGMAPPKSDLWHTRGDTLEQTLAYLKTFRNNITHDMTSLSLPEFMGETESLRDNQEKCLRLAGERYSIDKSEIERHVDEMNADISRIRDNPLVILDIKSFDNQPLFKEWVSILSTQGKAEIVEAYKKFCNFNPVSFITGKEFSLHIGNVFTRIEVVSDQKSPFDEKECHSIEYEQLLSFGSRSHSGSEKIKLIEGPAGSGKSTLTRKMIGDWVSGDTSMESLSSFDLVLYMECRNTTNTSFHQLLVSLMPKTAQRFREKSMVTCALALRLLIIVDGLDEMNKSSRQLFKEILHLKERHEISLFCTMRPEKIEDCYKMITSGEETTHLKITGIPATRREEFASKYHEELRKLGKSQQETRGLITYLKTSQRHLQDHLRLPLNLVLLTILWSIAPEKVNCVTTATELYYEIHKLTVDKLLLRLKSREETQHLSVHDLQCKVESFVVTLCKQALIGLKNDEIMLSDDSIFLLKNVCTRVGLHDEETLGAFLVHKIMWTSTGLLFKINYPHKGIQEFLSALFILLKLKDKGVPLDIRTLIRCDLQDISSEMGSKSHSRGDATLTNCGCMSRLSSVILRPCHRVHKRFRQAFCGEPEFHTGRTPLIHRIRRSVSGSLLVLVNGPPSTSVITSILQELYPDNEHVEYYKFKDAFIHLTGLLHLTSKNNISRPLVEELVGILQKTGIKKREEWLDLISNVKCSDIVADVIAEKIPSITFENITIKDSRVYSYLSLFQKRCPESLKVDITARPVDIPRLEELLCLLSEHMCEVTNLEFHDEFQYPSHMASSLDWAVQQIFQDCNVRCYRGAISQRFPINIPATIQKLRIGIANAEQFSALQQLLAANSTSLSSIKRLVVHLSKGIDYSQLTPLPRGLFIHLYLGDIDHSSVEWACKAAQSVQPKGRGFLSIMFPRCTLDVCDLEELVNGLVEADIKVSSAICTSANIPFTSVQSLESYTRSKLKTDFKLISEQDIWTKW